MKEPSLVPETSASANSAILAGAPDRIRTCGLPSRSRTLYPLSYKRESVVECYYSTMVPIQQEGIEKKLLALGSHLQDAQALGRELEGEAVRRGGDLLAAYAVLPRDADGVAALGAEHACGSQRCGQMQEHRVRAAVHGKCGQRFTAQRSADVERISRSRYAVRASERAIGL